MKQIFTILIAIALAGSSYAQLPDGEIAPDWTMTDIDGITHTLYDYLDQGKVVFIDVSATWCGPCWNYHNSHALRDLYNTYGPAGTDEVMVFFVEGDGSTTLDDLNGTGSSTYGDWVTGTPYPIINSTAINGSYDIGYFPTVYMICPDRVIKEVGQMTTNELYTQSQTCPDLTTAVNNSKVFRYNEPDGDYCDGAVRPRVEIQNYGTDDLVSLEIHSIVDGVAIDTFNWTGFIPMYDVELIVLDELPVISNGSHTYEFQTYNPNGSQDEDPSDDSATGTFSTNSMGTVATVKIKTDSSPNQTSWEIVSSTGVVASGGNYDTENFIYVTEVCLYEDSCYTLIVYDSGNNGLSGASFGLVMWDGSTIASFPASSFDTDSIHLNFCLGNDNSIDDYQVYNEINVFPNPATDRVTIQTNEFEHAKSINVQIINLVGKTIYQQERRTSSSQIEIPVSGFDSGVYCLMISDNHNNMYHCKLIIK
jgi:hypothetical protein